MRTDSGMDIMAENGDCPRKYRILIIISIFVLKIQRIFSSVS